MQSEPYPSIAPSGHVVHSGTGIADWQGDHLIGSLKFDYIARLVRATRDTPRVQVGASPRGGLALLKLSRGKAVLEGRAYVTPEDVKAVAVPALAHRLTLAPELWLQQLRGDEVVAELLEQVPTPAAEDLAERREEQVSD